MCKWIEINEILGVLPEASRTEASMCVCVCMSRWLEELVTLSLETSIQSNLLTQPNTGTQFASVFSVFFFFLHLHPH